MAGTLDASAPGMGNGGFIETSSAHVRVADGTRTTTAAAQGKTGRWLIDPTDYAVAASGGAPGVAINLPNVSPSSTTALVINDVPYSVINSLGADRTASGSDLQGMGGNLAGRYALGSNIDAGPTSTGGGPGLNLRVKDLGVRLPAGMNSADNAAGSETPSRQSMVPVQETQSRTRAPTVVEE